jgi:hypothetical protein
MPILDVVVTLSSAGTDAGPFTIKDNNNNTLVSGITRAQLLAGYRMDIFSEYPTLTVTSTGSCTTSASGTVSYTPPPAYYYSVSKFDCNNSCAQVGSNGGFAAYSTTQLTTGKHYYAGGYSWRVETTLTPAPSSYNVDLSNKTANNDCTGCQPVTVTAYKFYFAQQVDDAYLSTTYCSAQGYTTTQAVWATTQTMTPGQTQIFTDANLQYLYVGNWVAGVPSRVAFITETAFNTNGALNTNNVSGYSYVRIDSGGYVVGSGAANCSSGGGGGEF